MKLDRMTTREQVLVLVAALVIIGGAYGSLRYYPAHKSISNILSSNAAMDKALKTGTIPEVPMDDVDSLELDLADMEAELVEVRSMATVVESLLSPEDTTELRLAISEMARQAMVRITANEEYHVTVPPPVTKDAKKDAAQPKKRMGDAAKKRLKNERREARRAARRGSGIAGGVATISPEQTTALVRKMAVNGPVERPMQRLTMEGTYAGIMRFVRELENLDKMATIVYLQMTPSPRTPPPGYNQRIVATMVLAL